MKSRLLFIGLILIFNPVCGQTKTKAGIDQVVIDEMIKQELVGVAIGIVENGRITHLKGYGYSDRERKTRMNTKTPIRWASISKVLTAVAAYQLIEEGKLNESDKVSKYLSTSEWPQAGEKKNISIINLLMHRSGINHYGDGKGRAREGRYDSFKKSYQPSSLTTWDAIASVAMFRDAPLDFKPGTDFLYTTYGYNLLGAVLDKVSPKGYQQYIYDNIKKPLGLTTLAPSLNRWKGYTKDCIGVVEEEYDGGKMAVLPGGGWISNIEDATKFMKGLIDGKLLKFMPLLKCHSDNENDYCSGMQKIKRYGKTIIGHGGAHKNLRTAMYYFSGEKDGIIIMSNGEHTNRWQLFDRIAGKIGKGFGSTANYANADCSESCNEKFIGVWGQTGEKKIIRRGFTTEDFNKEWNYLKTNGYQIFDIEPHTKSGKLLWDGIFKKTRETGFAMWRNFSQADFDKKWREMSQKGYRLYDIETYVVSGKRKWAGLFKKGSGKYALFTNYSTSNFGKKRDELAKQGYKLIDIEVFDSKEGLKWTGVWVQGKDGLLNRNYNYSQFSGLISKRSKAGYQLIDIERYKSKGVERWAGIWEKSSQGQRYLMNSKYCQLTKFDDLKSKERYELIDIETY